MKNVAAGLLPGRKNEFLRTSSTWFLKRKKKPVITEWLKNGVLNNSMFSKFQERWRSKNVLQTVNSTLLSCFCFNPVHVELKKAGSALSVDWFAINLEVGLIIRSWQNISSKTLLIANHEQFLAQAAWRTQIYKLQQSFGCRCSPSAPVFVDLKSPCDVRRFINADTLSRVYFLRAEERGMQVLFSGNWFLVFFFFHRSFLMKLGTHVCRNSSH